MIEKYIHKEEGYNPFLIKEGFQVAKLNYLPTHGLDDIVDVEVHKETDEVFVLLKGAGVLVEAEIDNKVKLSYTKMEEGIVYNVPKGVWHNIAMSRDAEIIIVEKDNTHQKDVEHFSLTPEILQEAYREIASIL